MSGSTTISPSRTQGFPDAAPEPRGRPDGVPRWLVPCTLVYLVFPHVLFLVTWLRPVFGIVAAVTLVAAAVLAARSVPGPRRSFSPGARLGVLGFTVGMTWLSGAGNIGYQASDWWKHNAILTDLVARPWPVVYDIGQDVGLNYYLAHYLPAASVGKALGWTSANVALTLWTAAGLALVAFWLVVLVHHAWQWALLGFVALSGFDIVGWLLLEPLTGAPAVAEIRGDGPEFWNGNFAYLSQLTNVADAPHQSIGIWLLTAMAFWLIHEQHDSSWWPLLLVVSPFWSVFATVGLLPFAVVHIYRSGGSWRTRLRPLFTPGNLLLVPTALVFLAYFASRTAPLPDDISGGVDLALIFTSPRYDIGMSRILVAFVLFLAVELVVPSILVLRARGMTAAERHLASVAVAVVILVLPLKVSGNHDLMLRGSGPALFILTVLVSRLLARSVPGSSARRGLIALLLVGAITPGVVVVRALVDEQLPVYSATDPDVAPDLIELFGGSPWLSQYVGGTDSFFWSTLAADSGGGP